MTRQEANLEILDILAQLTMQYPDMRLNQLLIATHIAISNYDFQNSITTYDVSFYEEPQDTLARMKEKGLPLVNGQS